MGSVDNHSSILIVGAGIFGTSTAYHLSLSHHDPTSITVLDRAPFPSPRAASSDINKIVRADYATPFYMDLAYEALDEWANSQVLKPFYHQTGWVMLPDKGSDTAERTRANFKSSGRPDPSSDISFDEIRERWDGVFKNMDMTNSGQGYWNPEAGRADASAAVEALMNEAVSRGINYVVGEVTELVPSDSGLHGIATSDGRLFTADKILLATAAWTPWLMSPLEDALNIADADRMDRQITAAGCCTTAFNLSDAETARYDSSPVFIYGGKGEIMPSGRSKCIKFTNAHTFVNYETTRTGRKISVPPFSQPNQDVVPPGLKDECITLIRQRIPDILSDSSSASSAPPQWRICWDAISPDQNQLITSHPDPRLSANLYFATAGSFHSWKFLPTIGKYVVNVLEGVSNGEVKDRAWAWKTAFAERGAHEKVMPRGELKDF